MANNNVINTIGGAIKNLTFTVKLTANGWSEGAQTVSDSNFIVGDYLYTIMPERTSAEAYIAAGIYADDVTTDGSITFHCASVPEGKLKVTVLRMVGEVIPSFEWGEDGSTADEAWFAALQKEVQSGNADPDWVGLTKSVTLTRTVCDTTTHLIRCIGINQDGNNTITFQTKNGLKYPLQFDEMGGAVWSTSRIRTETCAEYYDAFPGRNYIKTVSKGTNTENNTDSVVYTDETVWLPSIYEMGLGDYEYAPVGTEYTQGCSTPYSYYSNDSTRIKSVGDTGNANHWRLRSRSLQKPWYTCCITSSGVAASMTYDIETLVAPAFVIG